MKHGETELAIENISRVGCGQFEETLNTIHKIWNFVLEATTEPPKVWRRAGNFSKMVTLART